MNFDWLIAPTTLEDFIQNHWGAAPLRIERNDRQYYTPLMGESDLEATLFTASHVNGAVEELLENDRARECRSHGRAVAAFREGKSLRIDSIQRFSYPIASLTRALEQVVSAHINTNLYLSPGEGGKALASHFDTHDVFVIQLYGVKRWRLYESSTSLPLEFLPLLQRETVRDMKNRLRERQEQESVGALTDEFLMHPGDFLYLPRGHWHDAKTEPGEVSCHLTIGVQPVTYADLLSIALSNAAKQNVDLRRPLPIGFATHSDARQQVGRQIDSLKKKLPETLDLTDSLSMLGGIFLRSHRSALENDLLKPQSGRAMQAIEPTTQIQVRKGMVFGIDSGTGVPRISFAGKLFEIDRDFEEACRFIGYARKFTPAELPGNLTIEQKITLVTQLVTENLLVAGSVEGLNAEPPPPSFEGWLPYRIKNEADTVEWLKLGKRPLSEPFFSQTIQRVLKEEPTTQLRTTPLASLLHMQEDLAPSGFVFHVSRCGSTMLSNAFRAIQDTIVISEPQPVGELLATERAPAMGNLDTVASKTQMELLEGVVRAFGRRRVGTEKALIIKFTSWNLFHLSTIAQLWPNVPCVVLVRDPLEVAASCVMDPPGWLRRPARKLIASRVPSLSRGRMNEMTRESFCAQVIGEFYRVAAANVSSHCRVVDYSDLSVAGVLDIAKFFNVEVTAEDQQAVEASMTLYSKDIHGVQQFTPDVERKRSLASDKLRAEVERWAQPQYEQIKVLKSTLHAPQPA